MGADNMFGNHQDVLKLINHKLTLCYICQKKKLIQHSCFFFIFCQEHLFCESGVGVCIDWCCHSEQNVQLWNLHRKLCPHFRVIFSQTTITTFQGRETDINKEKSIFFICCWWWVVFTVLTSSEVTAFQAKNDTIIYQLYIRSRPFIT